MVAPALVVFFFVYMISLFLGIGFGDWFVVWMGLEMNMMSFIGMMWVRSEGGSVESLYSYFFVQSLASGVFLVMMYVGGFVSLALMMKLAVGPFYFWLPGVMKGLSWMMNFILVSVQKLLPLILLKGVGGLEVMLMGAMSLVVGVIGSFNQSSLSALMAYSSVNHSGWMMIAQVLGGTVWMIYYLVYVIVVFPVFLYMDKSNMEFLGGNGVYNSVFFFLMVLNMAGIPPMVGFVMSWMVLRWVLEMDVMMGVMMIVSSLMMFYVYVRMVYEELVGGGESMMWMGEFGWDWFGFVVFFLLGSLMFPVFVVVIEWMSSINDLWAFKVYDASKWSFTVFHQ